MDVPCNDGMSADQEKALQIFLMVLLSSSSTFRQTIDDRQTLRRVIKQLDGVLTLNKVTAHQVMKKKPQR